MKSEASLESVVFQLTPTRTRCDLVIVANGKTERIASGLLKPFLSHLKSAQDQIAKGGYSIKLETDPSNSEWFTKGTVERFVRFVSTPEVLERVNTIEAEIIQIEEAIAIQVNEGLGLNKVQDITTRTAESTEGTKQFISDADKAIVLYKPEPTAADSNETTMQEENSKVHLLRVLENRKNVLQKEQGMAFARAVAAGFDMDEMPHLVAFAVSFGASRLKEASLRFMELWKCKHESGQWLEVEAAEALSSRSEFSLVNTSGIMLSEDMGMQKDYREGGFAHNGATTAESYVADFSSPQMDTVHNSDKRFPSDSHVSLSPYEYYQGHFPPHMFPQWPMHPPPGPPVYQPYPMQGVPYFQNYPGGAPYFPSSYTPTEDHRSVKSKKGRKQYSNNSKDSDDESEDLETSKANQGNVDEYSTSEGEKESHQNRVSHKKTNNSHKRLSRKAKSKKHNKSDTKSELASESESGEEIDQNNSDGPEGKRESPGSQKKKDGRIKQIQTSQSNDRNEVADSGNWVAFQSFLMKTEDETARGVDIGIFSSEKPSLRRREGSVVDPLFGNSGDSGETEERGIVEIDSMNVVSRRPTASSSIDELQILSGLGGSKNSLVDTQLKEVDGGRVHIRATNDEFIITGEQSPFTIRKTSDPLSENDFQNSVHSDKYHARNIPDESFMLPFRPGSPREIHSDSRIVLGMDSQIGEPIHKSEDSLNKLKNVHVNEPHDSYLLPQREVEMEPVSYDPAKDYDLQINFQKTEKLNVRHQEDKVVINEEMEKGEKENSATAVPAGNERRKVEPTRKCKLTKLNPLADAQSRADKVRAYKHDLQKLKREQEDEAIKRLEALKLERQKRIAARSVSSSAESSSKLPTKLSPSSQKSSKFSDSVPGSSSPMQNSILRTPVGHNSKGPNKPNKPSSAKPSNHAAENGLGQSITSLEELKKDSSFPEVKAAPVKSKRLSDPLGGIKAHISYQKSSTVNSISKKNLHDESQKKITAIMNIDQVKSSMLPELKIVASKGPLVKTQNKSSVKEEAEKGAASKTFLSSESSQVKKSKEKGTDSRSSDESPIIDKTIVMLQNDSVATPASLSLQGATDVKDGPYKDGQGGTVSVSDYEVSGDVPHLPPVVLGNFVKPNDSNLNESQNSFMDVVDHPEYDLQKPSSVIYQAPYARETSLEDWVTSKEEYAGPETDPSAVESIKAHISMFDNIDSAKQIHHVNEKPRSKESKGFRNLFKFGRKNYTTSGERNSDIDCYSPHDVAVGGATSAEVPTLKNLVCQDDTHSGSTTPKASRHFNFLSPFRAKVDDKKLAD